MNLLHKSGSFLLPHFFFCFCIIFLLLRFFFHFCGFNSPLDEEERNDDIIFVKTKKWEREVFQYLIDLFSASGIPGLSNNKDRENTKKLLQNSV